LGQTVVFLKWKSSTVAERSRNRLRVSHKISQFQFKNINRYIERENLVRFFDFRTPHGSVAIYCR